MTLVRPPLRTTRVRQGRVTPGQAAALERSWSVLGVEPDGRLLDPVALFGRRAPLVVEVGSGMGEATAVLAQAEPERDVLACELHRPGQGSLVRLAEAAGVTNLRVVDADGREVLELLEPGSVDVVRVFFPDPWPKSRHWKRRLVDDGFAALVASRLRPGGLLHVATDWAPYAAQIRGVLERCPDLQPATAPARPRTRFEQQGLDAGRPAHDLAAERA